MKFQYLRVCALCSNTSQKTNPLKMSISALDEWYFLSNEAFIVYSSSFSVFFFSYQVEYFPGE